jgi:hypothetical protein
MFWFNSHWASRFRFRGLHHTSAVAQFVGGYMRAIVKPLLLLLAFSLSALADLPAPLACYNNIGALDGAKEQLRIDRGLKIGDPVEPVMLTQYFFRGVLPQCPSGGTYTIGAIGQKPVCSIPAHSESEVLRLAAQKRPLSFPWLLFAIRFVIAGTILLGVIAVVRRLAPR